MTQALPEGWEWAQVPSIAENCDSRRVPLNSREREGRAGPYPYFGANGQVGTIDDYLFDGDHVLVAEDGGYFDDPTRKVSYLATGRFWVNNHAHVLRPLGDIDPRFIRDALNRVRWTDHISGTTRAKLTQGALNLVEVPVPPLAEQRRIVEKIEALTARSGRAREALAGLPALLDRYRAAVLAAAFRGDLTAEWREAAKPQSGEAHRQALAEARAAKWTEGSRRYQEPLAITEDWDLPALPEGWVWVSVDEALLGISAGKSFRCLERPPEDGEIGLVKISAVTWGAFDETKSKTVLEVDRVDTRNRIQPGDFLISRANTIELVGACVIVQEVTRELYLSDKVLRLEFAVDLREWIMWWLRSAFGRFQIETGSSGNQMSMRNIGQTALRKIAVPLPSPDEINEILQRLKMHLHMETLVTNQLGAQTARLATLDSAILAKAFRGELVPQDPTDEPASALLERIRAERAADEDKPRRGRRKREVAA